MRAKIIELHEADTSPEDILTTMQADVCTVSDIEIGQLLHLMNFRGMLIKRIRPTDNGEKWTGTIPAMIAAADAEAPEELALAVNQWFSHITNPRNSVFATTEPAYAAQFAAIVGAFADGDDMPTSADFAAVLSLGGGLRFANITLEFINEAIAEHEAQKADMVQLERCNKAADVAATAARADLTMTDEQIAAVYQEALS